MGLGVNSWDDPFGLQRLLTDKIINFFDKIIIIEGRYKERNDSDKYQTVVNNLIVKLDKKHPNKISFSRTFDKSQIEKRNKYFKIAGDYVLDFLIVIDSDEYIEIEDWKLDLEFDNLFTHNHSCFPIFGKNMGFDLRFPRLFKHPGALEYRKTSVATATSHASVYNRITGKEVIDESNHYDEKDKRKCVEGIKIFHDKSLRTIDRVLADEVYYTDTPNR